MTCVAGRFMKGSTTRALVGAAAAWVLVCLWGVSLVGQSPFPAARPTMAEDVFKDVEVLKGTTAKQFMDTMGLFAASLNANCTACHVEEAGGDWGRYADDHPNKEKARRMVDMVAGINRTYFWGRPVVTCYSCHRFGSRPKVIPSIDELYSTPVDEDPDEVPSQAPSGVAVDRVLDRYIQAVGGAERLAALTSWVGRGEYKSFDDAQNYPLDVYATAPGLRATIMHSPRGDRAMVYDGRVGWDAVPSTDRPFDLVLPLEGEDLHAAKLEAELSFPGRIKQALGRWRLGPLLTIDDRDVQVVQGVTAAGEPVKLYFDEESGLLTRTLRYTTLPLGRIPVRIDYSDYREVSGIKLPFQWRVRWTDGELEFDLNEIRLNVAVDAGRFGKPAVPVPPR
jgi:hypothetical protein